MSKTGISWCEYVWNPWVGCSKVGRGCQHCYAERMAFRLKAMGRPEYQDVVDAHGHWTGHVQMVKERRVDPLHWRKGRVVFVGSMTDICHEQVSDEMIWHVLKVTQWAPQHTYIFLTKRPRRMVEVFGDWQRGQGAIPGNVWAGVSAEGQPEANERVAELLKLGPGWNFMLSAEPLLEPLDIRHFLTCQWYAGSLKDPPKGTIGGQPYHTARLRPRLEWVIVGGESGAGGRWMDPWWAEDLYAQCREAGVPFFGKQLSGWHPGSPLFLESVGGRLVQERPAFTPPA